MDLIPESGNPARDIYKAMVMDMDMAVAEIVATLKETGLYNDTLIVFTSDNGGAISHGASNWPLRCAVKPVCCNSFIFSLIFQGHQRHPFRGRHKGCDICACAASDREDGICQ